VFVIALFLAGKFTEGLTIFVLKDGTGHFAIWKSRSQRADRHLSLLSVQCSFFAADLAKRPQ